MISGYPLDGGPHSARPHLVEDRDVGRATRLASRVSQVDLIFIDWALCGASQARALVVCVPFIAWFPLQAGGEC
jgi:hypothetical protein